MLRTTTAVAAALLVATTAGAQEAPQQSAVNANVEAARVNAVTDARDADAKAQYDGDLAAYHDALIRHDAQAMRDEAHYRHQQRAYADAMAAWRAQDYACRHGSTRACNAPAPDPAAYW